MLRRIWHCARAPALTARRDSRRHLRLAQLPTPTGCSDEETDELATRNGGHAGDDDPPPTLLAW
jgi:hypothetical protein